MLYPYTVTVLCTESAEFKKTKKKSNQRFDHSQFAWFACSFVAASYARSFAHDGSLHIHMYLFKSYASHTEIDTVRALDQRFEVHTHTCRFDEMYFMFHLVDG